LRPAENESECLLAFHGLRNRMLPCFPLITKAKACWLSTDYESECVLSFR
jgi:hypothetical protein